MPGLRLQLLLLLGGLLLVTFLPLQLALATYTRVMLRRVDDTQAQALAGVLSAYIEETQSRLAPDELLTHVQRAGEVFGLAAARTTEGSGTLRQFGDTSALAALAEDERHARASSAEPRFVRAGERRLLLSSVASARSTTELAIFADLSSARGATLIRIFGLYAFLMASSLLTLAYFALTRLIVRPLDHLSQAAQSVTLGSRQLLVPASGVRELNELGASLTRMTHRLLAKEESLRKQIDEVERTQNELAKAQRELVRSERLASVGRLAAGLAHEIGNPIAALMGLADLLLEGGLEPEEQRDFIKRMRAETERVNGTLRDLLQFARPARAGSNPSSSPGDVEAAIHDTAALVMHQASVRDLELCLDMHPGLPRVPLAREQLIQVVLNLVLNAADALQGRSGGRVSLTARSSDAGVRIEVEDNGPGVPKDIADHIFEPFFTTKEIGKGTGLGLSVCQSLVAAAGGALTLDASYSAGARFVVELPAAGGASERS